MLIVDTSVWIDYFRDLSNPDHLEEEIERSRIGVPDLVLCELLQGAPNESVAERIRLDLSVFQPLDTGGARLAVVSAQNYRLLRSKGFTVRSTVDCLIATFCLLENHTLLHRDRDFDLFERHLNLRVAHLSAR